MKTIKLTIKSKKINDLIPIILDIHKRIGNTKEVNMSIEYSDNDTNIKVRQLMDLQFNKQ